MRLTRCRHSTLTRVLTVQFSVKNWLGWPLNNGRGFSNRNGGNVYHHFQFIPPVLVDIAGRVVISIFPCLWCEQRNEPTVENAPTSRSERERMLEFSDNCCVIDFPRLFRNFYYQMVSTTTGSPCWHVALTNTPKIQECLDLNHPWPSVSPIQLHHSITSTTS